MQATNSAAAMASAASTTTPALNACWLSSSRAWLSSAPYAPRSRASERSRSLCSIGSIRNSTSDSVETVSSQRMAGAESRTRARVRLPHRSASRSRPRRHLRVEPAPPRSAARVVDRAASNRMISRSNQLSCSHDGFPHEQHRGRTANKGASRRPARSSSSQATKVVPSRRNPRSRAGHR